VRENRFTSIFPETGPEKPATLAITEADRGCHLEVRYGESATYSCLGNLPTVFLLLLSVETEKRCNLRKLVGFIEAMGLPRVLLADDHPKMLEQVAQLLECESEIVGTVENGEELIEAAFNLDPDLIVLDISMPVLNGIEAAHHIKNFGSRAKVIFLTMHEDDAFVTAAVSAGALGYVLKHRISIDLIPAMRKVLQGHVFASPPLRMH
jgi:CheY-like chemotaxis protein